MGLLFMSPPEHNFETIDPALLLEQGVHVQQHLSRMFCLVTVVVARIQDWNIALLCKPLRSTDLIVAYRHNVSVQFNRTDYVLGCFAKNISRPGQRKIRQPRTEPKSRHRRLNSLVRVLSWKNKVASTMSFSKLLLALVLTIGSIFSVNLKRAQSVHGLVLLWTVCGDP